MKFTLQMQSRPQIVVVKCVVRDDNERLIMNFVNHQGSSIQDSSSDEDSEDDLMSEMFGMSCNMTVEDAEESDEEIDFNDTPSKNITKLQIPSKHPRLNNLRQQKSMDKVKENPKLNEKSVEKEKVASKARSMQNSEGAVLKASESSEANHICKTATAKSQGTTFEVIDTIFPADSVEFYVDNFLHVCDCRRTSIVKKKDRCGDVHFTL